MTRVTERSSLGFVLRGNRLDGPGLYYGRRGRIGPVDEVRLEGLLRDWRAHDPYKRMGIIPLIEPGCFDDGAEHTVDALLGDRLVEFSVDDDMTVPGMLAGDLPGFIVRKQTAMKAADEARFRELAELHRVPFEGLLDGPFEAHLYRSPRWDELPERLALLCGLGMRPAESEGLPPPDGMTSWLATEDWRIDGMVVAEVTAPTIHQAVPVDAIVAAIEAARDAVRMAVVTERWQRFMAEAWWTEADLEVLLHVRPS